MRRLPAHSLLAIGAATANSARNPDLENGYGTRSLSSRGGVHMVRTAPESHADTRLFYIVHNTFRLGTNRMVDATEKLPASVLQPAIGSAWGFYAGVLDHHHHTEDTSILPALVAVRPDLQPLINDLSNDHRRLIEALEAVNAAVTAFERQPDAEHQR